MTPTHIAGHKWLVKRCERYS